MLPRFSRNRWLPVEKTDPVSMSQSREWRTTHKLANRRRFHAIASLIIVAGLLVACADESGPVDDRRFANDPVTRAVEVATPTEAPPPAVAPTPPPAGSPEALLHVQGGPVVLYVQTDETIDIVDTVDPERRRSIAIAPARIVDLAGAPNGDQVAVLVTSTEDGGAVDVVVYDREGEEVRRWTNLGELATSEATPLPDPVNSESTGGFVTWAADGERLLVSTNGTDLIAIEIAGDVQQYALPARVQMVEYALWSPLGDQIGFLSRDDDGAGAIWTMDPFVDGLSSRQVTPPNADAFNLGSVTQFSWLPDGSGFVYILATEPGESNPGGQLYAYDLESSQRALVATPGRGGPSARIVDFAVSPDGQVVAYIISIPSGDRWRFHSLWVRGLTTSNVFRVPTSQTDQIDGLWWSQPGLVWRQQSEDGQDIVLKSDSTEARVLRDQEDLALATPAPVATPFATPLAATPIATPDAATPISGTPPSGTPVASPHSDGTPTE